MIMIFHEAVAMTQSFMSLEHFLKDEEELHSVTIILEKRQTGIVPLEVI